MGIGTKEVTIEELEEFLRSQKGDFIIHVGPGEEDANGGTENVSA